MTNLDLDAIEARANAVARLAPWTMDSDAFDLASTDVPALIAEVRRLRERAEAHAVTVQQAVAVERQRDEARAEGGRLQALVNAKQSWIDGAKVDLDGYDDARASIAAVREACVGVEDCDYATTVVANVLAALDVRHDPSATTTIPINVAREHAWLANYALEMLVDTGDGTYHPIADVLANVRDLLDPSATTEGGAS